MKRGNLAKQLAAVILPLSMAGCATAPQITINHKLDDECLHRAEDQNQQDLSVDFNEKCGQHKVELAVAKINAEKQKQTAIIEAEKTKAYWQEIAVALPAVSREKQIEFVYNAERNKNPDVRNMAQQSKLALGITDSEIAEQTQIWQAQAKPGIDIIKRSNGAIYMDASDKPYGPFAGQQPN